jgi:hypothetical protein
LVSDRALDDPLEPPHHSPAPLPGGVGVDREAMKPAPAGRPGQEVEVSWGEVQGPAGARPGGRVARLQQQGGGAAQVKGGDHAAGTEL